MASPLPEMTPDLENPELWTEGHDQQVATNVEENAAKQVQGELNQKQRTFPKEMIGKAEILGDIVSPIVDEENWECLK